MPADPTEICKRDAVAAAVGAFLDGIRGLRHELRHRWETGADHRVCVDPAPLFAP